MVPFTDRRTSFRICVASSRSHQSCLLGWEQTQLLHVRLVQVLTDLHLVEVCWLPTAMLKLVEASHRLHMHFKRSYHGDWYLRQLFHWRERTAGPVLPLMRFESWVVMGSAAYWLQFLTQGAVSDDSAWIARTLHFALLGSSWRLIHLGLIFLFQNLIYSFLRAYATTSHLFTENGRACLDQILVFSL